MSSHTIKMVSIIKTGYYEAKQKFYVVLMILQWYQLSYHFAENCSEACTHINCFFGKRTSHSNKNSLQIENGSKF